MMNQHAKRRKRSTWVALTAVAALCVLTGFDILHEFGVVQCTRKNGYGCLCHDFAPSSDVGVTVDGPARVRVGHPAMFSIRVRGGTKTAAGYNVAAGHGTLEAADTSSQVLAGELCHTRPLLFLGDSVQWNFLYTGPAPGLDTIYSVANTVNGDHVPMPGDVWNYGDDLVIEVVDSPDVVAGTPEAPAGYSLSQNYPNPFNPVTHLQFTIANSQFVTLTVFDVLGRTVATPVRELKQPGTYHVDWDASGLPTGVYVYRLQAGAFIQTKKLVILE